MDEGKQRKMDKIREWGKAALFILVMIPVGLAILACALAARALKSRAFYTGHDPGGAGNSGVRSGCQGLLRGAGLETKKKRFRGPVARGGSPAL